MPSSKTDRLFEGNRIIVRRRHDPDPLLPFITYIKLRDRHFPCRAELWLREDGSVPTRSWFIHHLRAYFPSDIAGQSLRAGGATDLALHGSSPEAIMMAGRWLSGDWHKYVRRHPVPMHTLFFNGLSSSGLSSS